MAPIYQALTALVFSTMVFSSTVQAEPIKKSLSLEHLIITAFQLENSKHIDETKQKMFFEKTGRKIQREMIPLIAFAVNAAKELIDPTLKLAEASVLLTSKALAQTETGSLSLNDTATQIHDQISSIAHDFFVMPFYSSPEKKQAYTLTDHKGSVVLTLRALKPQHQKALVNAVTYSFNQSASPLEWPESNWASTSPYMTLAGLARILGAEEFTILNIGQLPPSIQKIFNQLLEQGAKSSSFVPAPASIFNSNLLWSEQTGILLCESTGETKQGEMERIPEWTAGYLNILDPVLGAPAKVRLNLSNYESALDGCAQAIRNNLMLPENLSTLSQEAKEWLENFKLEESAHEAKAIERLKQFTKEESKNNKQKHHKRRLPSAVLPVSPDTAMYISMVEGTVNLLSRGQLKKYPVELFLQKYQEVYKNTFDLSVFVDASLLKTMTPVSLPKGECSRIFQEYDIHTINDFRNLAMSMHPDKLDKSAPDYGTRYATFLSLNSCRSNKDVKNYFNAQIEQLKTALEAVQMSDSFLNSLEDLNPLTFQADNMPQQVNTGFPFDDLLFLEAVAEDPKFAQLERINNELIKLKQTIEELEFEKQKLSASDETGFEQKEEL